MATIIDTRKYYKKLIKKNENLEITYDMYRKVVNDYNFHNCQSFSSEHYNLMYTLFEEKIKTIQNKKDKIKYLNTQLSIYENLKTTKIIDIGLTVLAGGFFGVKIIDFNTLSNALMQLVGFVWLASILWCTYMKLSIVYKSLEWDFFIKVLKQLKLDVIEETNDKNCNNFRKLVGNLYIEVGE